MFKNKYRLCYIPEHYGLNLKNESRRGGTQTRLQLALHIHRLQMGRLSQLRTETIRDNQVLTEYTPCPLAPFCSYKAFKLYSSS